MLFIRLLGLMVVVGLAGCQRSVAVRATTPPATPVVEFVRYAKEDAQQSGEAVNGLALSLSRAQNGLALGKQVPLVLTLHNHSDKTFQVALHDQGCCLWGNLQFKPPLEMSQGGHTVKPNFFPGNVHRIFGGGQIALRFHIERSADGRSLFMPTQAHGGQGCGNTFALPADLKKVDLQFRLYDSSQANWSNLQYTEQRWSGECISNAVTLQLE